MKTIIVGAGMSGLIAGTMLGDDSELIAEFDSDVPNKHKALLRFRTSIVGDTLNIPFKKVNVLKTRQKCNNEVADAITYSLKTTGMVNLRSIISADAKIDDRYIAPDDFISQLADRLKRKFCFNWSMISVLEHRRESHPIISTIPMSALMSALQYPEIPDFKTRTGTVLTYELPDNYDIYCTVYIPDPWAIPYRVSITGRTLIIEASGNIETNDGVLNMIETAVNALSLKIDHDEIFAKAKTNLMQYAKISPIDEDERKKFIMWATREHNIYSLGRYACWRPGLLLDDIVNDVRVIQRLISGDKSHQYNQMKGK